MTDSTMTLSRNIFNTCIKSLEAAFRVHPLNKDSLGVYYKHLQDISDEDFKAACREIVLKNHYFPSISQFRQIAKSDKTPDWF